MAYPSEFMEVTLLDFWFTFLGHHLARHAYFLHFYLVYGWSVLIFIDNVLDELCY